MITSSQARTLLHAIILLVFVPGHVVADDKIVVVPMDLGSDSTSESTRADDVWCSISTGTTVVSPIQVYESPGGAVDLGQLAGTSGFDVDAGTHNFNLVCRHVGTSGSSTVSERSMTAIFIPGS